MNAWVRRLPVGEWFQKVLNAHVINWRFKNKTKFKDIVGDNVDTSE